MYGQKKWADLSPEERWERNKHLKMLEKQTRQLTPTEPLDETYKRIQYTRYADDFIIGVIGSKADAEQMKLTSADFSGKNWIWKCPKPKPKLRIQETEPDF